VGVQEVRCDKAGTEPEDNYTFFYGEGNDNHHLQAGFFVYVRITLSVKGVEFLSNRTEYITL